MKKSRYESLCSTYACHIRLPPFFKGRVVHISHSGLFQMNPEKTISSIAATLKLKDLSAQR